MNFLSALMQKVKNNDNKKRSLLFFSLSRFSSVSDCCWLLILSSNHQIICSSAHQSLILWCEAQNGNYRHHLKANLQLGVLHVVYE